jgi:hypothetical protein
MFKNYAYSVSHINVPIEIGVFVLSAFSVRLLNFFISEYISEKRYNSVSVGLNHIKESSPQKGVTSSGLKGHHISAQGNALGRDITKI